MKNDSRSCVSAKPSHPRRESPEPSQYPQAKSPGEHQQRDEVGPVQREVRETMGHNVLCIVLRNRVEDEQSSSQQRIEEQSPEKPPKRKQRMVHRLSPCCRTF